MSNMLSLHGIDTEHFLKNYWQQKALFMPAALPNFHSPLDEHDLAALAMQEGIEARLISKDDNGQWHLQHGPLDEHTLQNPPHQKWTLLVQAVDLWIDEVAELKNHFHFLPSFRLDDIMISYAPTGGSVGAHFDYYDVFLIQAQGTRRWQIGQSCDEATAIQKDQPINILQNFEKTDEAVLTAGDILYVPPGVAHHGISESDDCLTISIGFRSPSTIELMDEIIQSNHDSGLASKRFTDQATKQQHRAKIEAHDIEQARQLILESLLDDNNIIEALGRQFSQKKYPELVFGEQQNITTTDTLIISPDARVFYYKGDDQLTIFANGEKLSSNIDEGFLQSLIDGECIDQSMLSPPQTQLITQLISLGCFILEAGN